MFYKIRVLFCCGLECGSYRYRHGYRRRRDCNNYVISTVLSSKPWRLSNSESTAVKPGQVRCGEHSDYGTVTLLFQDDIGGLEVRISVCLKKWNGNDTSELTNGSSYVFNHFEFDTSMLSAVFVNSPKRRSKITWTHYFNLTLSLQRISVQ